MNNEDRKKFAELMAGCASAYRQEVDATTAKVFWSVLEKYDIGEIEKSVYQHISSSKFFPTPAEIIECIPGRMNGKHLGPEEAWAIALRSFDESLPVVLTDEILQAKAAAQDIWDYGDSIGSRMAFREAYNRLLLNSSEPKWFLSVGTDKSLTVDVVQEAVRLGRLPQKALEKYQYLGIENKTTAKALIEESDKRQGTSTDLSRLGLH